MKGVTASTGHNWRFKDITGQRFGRLVVESYAGTNSGGMALWNCKCDCGGIAVVTGSHLRNGHTRSCGCFHDETAAKRFRTHGLSKTRLYTIWASMIDRCCRAESESFKYYGGRGINVCDRWRHSFENFLSDMGECPEGLTLERKDTNGNYEPDNCVWDTIEVQANNRRNNKHLTIDGETKTYAQWEKLHGLREGAISNRLRNGQTITQL